MSSETSDNLVDSCAFIDSAFKDQQINRTKPNTARPQFDSTYVGVTYDNLTQNMGAVGHHGMPKTRNITHSHDYQTYDNFRPHMNSTSNYNMNRPLLQVVVK